MTLIPPTDIILRPQMVISGADGQLSCSITVYEFWTHDTIATEVRPAMKFPQDLHVALLWIEERILHYANAVPPF